MRRQAADDARVRACGRARDKESTCETLHYAVKCLIKEFCDIQKGSVLQWLRARRDLQSIGRMAGGTDRVARLDQTPVSPSQPRFISEAERSWRH